MPKPLIRKEIEDYLLDALGLEASNFEDFTVRELVLMLKNNGELGTCYDYNNKFQVL